METVKIPLTRGKYAIVDIDDSLRVTWACSWYAHEVKNQFYAMGQIQKRRIYLHHFVLGILCGIEVDHIDRDRLNNSKSNLRIVTHSENCANKTKFITNTSGFKGVYNERGKWRARIECLGKSHSCGVFENIIDAALAYDKKARELYGQHALVNFPEETNGIR